MTGGVMVLRDAGNFGQTHGVPTASEKIGRARRRRLQLVTLLVCAMASWGLIALLYYFVEWTESYWR